MLWKEESGCLFSNITAKNILDSIEINFIIVVVILGTKAPVKFKLIYILS